MLLDSAFNKDLFLEIVARAKKKYDFRIENFCIMGNHFHFIIQPINGSSLSDIMKWILGVFTMNYNRIHQTWGHFWGDRFFSRPIASLPEYLQVFKYIDDNPLKACQVERADEWRHGGLWHFRWGLRDILDALPEWLVLLFPGRWQLALA
jgi:REP element-mobilizing transposase RayT